MPTGKWNCLCMTMRVHRCRLRSYTYIVRSPTLILVIKAYFFGSETVDVKYMPGRTSMQDCNDCVTDASQSVGNDSSCTTNIKCSQGYSSRKSQGKIDLLSIYINRRKKYSDLIIFEPLLPGKQRYNRLQFGGHGSS